MKKQKPRKAKIVSSIHQKVDLVHELGVTLNETLKEITEKFENLKYAMQEIADAKGCGSPECACTMGIKDSPHVMDYECAVGLAKLTLYDLEHFE
jgi:hypothetical protein